jgi:hypothetical protein
LVPPAGGATFPLAARLLRAAAATSCVDDEADGWPAGNPPDPISVRRADTLGGGLAARLPMWAGFHRWPHLRRLLVAVVGWSSPSFGRRGRSVLGGRSW